MVRGEIDGLLVVSFHVQNFRNCLPYVEFWADLMHTSHHWSPRGHIMYSQTPIQSGGLLTASWLKTMELIQLVWSGIFHLVSLICQRGLTSNEWGPFPQIQEIILSANWLTFVGAASPPHQPHLTPSWGIRRWGNKEPDRKKRKKTLKFAWYVNCALWGEHLF